MHLVFHTSRHSLAGIGRQIGCNSIITRETSRRTSIKPTHNDYGPFRDATNSLLPCAGCRDRPQHPITTLGAIGSTCHRELLHRASIAAFIPLQAPEVCSLFHRPRTNANSPARTQFFSDTGIVNQPRLGGQVEPMAPSSREALLVELYYHVVLPRYVPGQEHSQLCQIESELASRLTEAARQLISHAPLDDHSHLDAIRLALTTCKSLHVEGKVDKNLLVQEFRDLDSNKALIIHVTEQNAALLVYVRR